MGRTKVRDTRHAMGSGSSLLTLRRKLTSLSAQLADLSSAPVPHASTVDLATAKKQIQLLKRSVGSISRHITKLSKAIEQEQRRRNRLPTGDSPTVDTTPNEEPSCPGLYNGTVTFGLGQSDRRLVPAIYEMLDDFPDCNELGYCKVRVGEDVIRTVDRDRIGSYTVKELDGCQSAAVAIEEWGGRDELVGLVCSLFIANSEEETPISSFDFRDMQAAEAEAGSVHLDGRALFCSTVEAAAEGSHKPYLVIPTDCTSDWRLSAGLPAEPYVHCGSRLARTAGKVAGVHTPYEYISSAASSATGMHVEDALLGSINILFTGAPKVWLIVPPSALGLLEAKVKKALTDPLRFARPCSQFVRHMDALLSPRLLEEWKVPYHIVTCRAGEMVVTLPGAYHQVANAGPNYAQAINFAPPGWSGPPEGYSFCGPNCPLWDPPTAAHFRFQEGEDESEEAQKDHRHERVADGVRDDIQVGSKDEVAMCSEKYSGPNAVRKPEDDFDSWTSLDHTMAPAVLHTSRTLSQLMVNNLKNPRKRPSTFTADVRESDSDVSGSEDFGSSSVEFQAVGLPGQCATLSHSPDVSTPLEIDHWRESVSQAARAGGFCVDGVLQALRNAPNDQSCIKVLRTLQCICEIANIPLLLQIKSHLQTPGKASYRNTKDGRFCQGVRGLVHLHQNISTLQAVSFLTCYQIAAQKMEYFQLFEAVVAQRKAATKLASDERRNLKKRQSRGTSTPACTSPLRPVQVRAIVKNEILRSMEQDENSRHAAKGDLEAYLKHGRIFHLLLGSASPSLLVLLPLYDLAEKAPSLDLSAFCPPGKGSEKYKRDLAAPIGSSCLLKASFALATYFGKQLFVARPELEEYWHGDQGSSAEEPSPMLLNISEQEMMMTKPTEVSRLFRRG
ncbi:transcription factor jumonji aspartyl beta-hydroxylase [Diplodia corticola]|uniref:Transcription factor jumonji aspartyl beta-hydroxylase n=1 Tax=Diplodia corticola TaxID=236234 RepID=A0A1J9QUM2_9PEZI|nr:transcription factor jumonji aspartyl beta-hydroxylase [Diplodia corticola]OJD32670.1 transcription factor jumonji aspartyl beta-hydroxylase [Diplodia corticola]